MNTLRIEPSAVDALIETLRRSGFTVVGPTVRDRAIVYDELRAAAELPVGWTDEQEAGTYRLKARDDDALFGYVVGPHSWKKYLFPASLRLWRADRTDDGFEISQESGNGAPKYAFFGVRSCELNAISIQDRVFEGGDYVDPVYRTRRESVFLVAVSCTVTGGTCFCASMGTGPRATAGFDLCLTEVIEPDRHYLLVEPGTQRGEEILGEVPHRDATAEEIATASVAIGRAATQMGRSLDTEGIRDLLYSSYEHRRWDDVASRCETCANCTMVCPTCFCSTTEDVTDLTGEHAERWRRWDSCFTLDFSYIHGGSVRPSARSRYRQWLTHKLATWLDQFGTSGCVGCGRCITWCPVGIDITEEIKAIRGSEGQEKANG